MEPMDVDQNVPLLISGYTRLRGLTRSFAHEVKSLVKTGQDHPDLQSYVFERLTELADGYLNKEDLDQMLSTEILREVWADVNLTVLSELETLEKSSLRSLEKQNLADINATGKYA